MTLAQLGADVIRFDPIGGGLDRTRWPVTDDGESLFWAGLNKGKRSIQRRPALARGQELLTDLITAPGPDAGMFLTNFPRAGWLDYEALAERRPDLIMVNIVGNHDGSARRSTTRSTRPPGFPGRPARATSRCRSTTCFPPGTRSPARLRPPGCWPPSATGARTGEGQLVRVALSDVAFAMVGNLGKIAEAQVRQARAQEGRQLPLRRLRAGLPHPGRAAGS